MKYTRGQFTQEYYRLWHMGLLLSTPSNASLFIVKYRKNEFDDYSRVTLRATSVSDALERACYAVTYTSPWNPEDVDLHAVYDEEENLLWIDEPFYDLVQKKHEFRGMERREFLARFGATGLAVLFGFKPRALSATTNVSLGGTSSGFSGEKLYTTAGSYSWVVPANVSSVCVVCIGGGGASGPGYGSGSAGGGLGYTNNISVTPGATITVVAGAAGAPYSSVPTSNGQTSQFGNFCYAYGGGSGLSGSAPAGGSFSGSGGGNGGAGGVYVATGGYGGGSGGGGAGGYSGNGGQGGSWAGTSVGAGSSGSGGGGGGGGGGNAGTGGGGVGLYGGGASGTGGAAGGWYDYNASSSGGPSASAGNGGSGGASAAAYAGGAYGGGTCSATAVAGGAGAVRIIWGTGRSFPNNAA